MDEGVRRRILTSVSAGALAGVLGAGGMAVAVGGPTYPADVVPGVGGDVPEEVPPGMWQLIETTEGMFC